MTEARAAELLPLDESTCFLLLAVHHVGRLIVPGDDPYVIPVNYITTQGAIVFRTERRPVIEAVVDRSVVFEVDMFDDRTKSGWSVVVRGMTREYTHDVNAGSGSSIAVPEAWAPGDRDLVIRIEPERISGRLLRGAVTTAPTDDRGYL